MGDATPGDGRLDLDDLDRSLDEAATLDVVAAGSENRWSDRIADSRLGGWVRRHRVAVLVTCVVGVVVVVGASAVVRLMPPPFDPELRLTVTASEPDELPGGYLEGRGRQLIGRTSSGTHRAGYFLRPVGADGQDTYRVLGIVGPAIRASTAHPRPAGPGVFGSNVDAVLDCRDRSAIDQRGAPFELVVERTDAFARTLVGRVAIPEPDGWSSYVGDTCAQERVQTDVRLESVRADSASDRWVRVTFEVSSELPVDTRVRAGIDGETLPVELPANGTATLPALLQIGDCSSRFRLVQGRELPNGEYVDTPGAPLVVTVPPDHEIWVSAWWSASVAEQLNQVFDAPCAGAPSAGAVVTSARVTSDPTLYLKQADLTLVVESPGVSVTVTRPEAVVGDVGDGSGDGDAAVITRETLPLVGGRAEFPLTWEFACSELGAPPPVEFTVTSTEGVEFPFAVPMNGAGLTAEVLAVCGSLLDRDTLLDEGWAPPA